MFSTQLFAEWGVKSWCGRSRQTGAALRRLLLYRNSSGRSPPRPSLCALGRGGHARTRRRRGDSPVIVLAANAALPVSAEVDEARADQSTWVGAGTPSCRASCVSSSERGRGLPLVILCEVRSERRECMRRVAALGRSDAPCRNRLSLPRSTRRHPGDQRRHRECGPSPKQQGTT